MFFIFRGLTKKSSLYLLLLNGERILKPSTVNWIMTKRNASWPSRGKEKIQKTSPNDSKFVPPNHSTSQVTEVNGDLFSCPDTHSLALCISADITMKKGIAVRFKTLFGGEDELLYQRQGPGGLALLKRGQRFVYYLVTKGRYFDKPTYDTLWSSLKKMRDHNMKWGVKSLCMPKIGCGLDRLEWHKVLKMIREIYKNTDVQITVYNYGDNSKGKGRGKGKQSGPYPYGNNAPPYHQQSHGPVSQKQSNIQDYAGSQPSSRGGNSSQEELPDLSKEDKKQLGKKQNSQEKPRGEGSAAQTNQQKHEKMSSKAKPVKINKYWPRAEETRNDVDNWKRGESSRDRSGDDSQHKYHGKRRDYVKKRHGSQNKSGDDSQYEGHEERDYVKKRDGSRDRSGDDSQYEGHEKRDYVKKRDGSRDRSGDGSQYEGHEKRDYVKKRDGSRDRSGDDSQYEGHKKRDDVKKRDGSRDRSGDDSQYEGHKKRDYVKKRDGSRDRSGDDSQYEGHEKRRDDVKKRDDSRDRRRDDVDRRKRGHGSRDRSGDNQDHEKGSDCDQGKDHGEERNESQDVEHREGTDGSQDRSGKSEHESEDKYSGTHDKSKDDHVVPQESKKSKIEGQQDQNEKKANTNEISQEYQEDNQAEFSATKGTSPLADSENALEMPQETERGAEGGDKSKMDSDKQGG